MPQLDDEVEAAIQRIEQCDTAAARRAQIKKTLALLDNSTLPDLEDESYGALWRIKALTQLVRAVVETMEWGGPEGDEEWLGHLD